MASSYREKSLHLGCIIAIFLIAMPAESATLWKITSDENDPVALGQDRLVDESTGTFTVEAGEERGLLVTYDEGEIWTFGIAPALLGELTTGFYQAGRRYPYPGPMEPAMNVIMAGRDCPFAAGWFAVHELEYDGDGNVLALAIDYEISCFSAGRSQSGNIRFNSMVDLGSDNPVASAGDDYVVPEGRTANLDGTYSWVAEGSIVSYQWTQLSGVPVVTQNDAGEIAQFTSPDVTPGGNVLTFQLQVTTDTNKTHTDTVAVRVTDTADRRTVISIDTTTSSGSVETSREISPADGEFQFVIRPTTMQIEVNFFGIHGSSSGDTWHFNFRPPKGESWRVSDYRRASGDPADSEPMLRVYPGCSSSTGRFVLYELTVAADQTIESLAIDFEGNCNINGRIRINSDIPVYTDIPWASAGDDWHANENELVNLNASESSIGYGVIVSHSWQQIAGPIVQITNEDQIAAQFTTPFVDVRGSDLLFEVTATSDTGKSDSAEVSIHTKSKSDPQTYFSYNSEPGDSVGLGLSGTYYDNEWVIWPEFASSNGASFSVENLGSPREWYGDFIAVNDVQLKRGLYPNIIGLPSSQTSRNRMDIRGPGGRCIDQIGFFRVLDIRYVNGGASRFAIDFEQQCVVNSIAQPPLTGQIRVNHVDLSVPIADAGLDLYAVFGATVIIDGTGSQDADGAITAYHWRQVSGPSLALGATDQATLQFDAPTDIQSASMAQMLAFELIVTDGQGFQDWDAVNVTVGGGTSPFAADDDLVVAVNTTTRLAVLVNDYDPDGDPIDVSQVELVGQPVHGEASVDTSDGTIVYIPDSSFLGIDNLQYRIVEPGGAGSAVAQVSIIVNSPPVAADDEASIAGSLLVSVPVTVNDTDSDDAIDETSVVVVTQPVNGTARIGGSGTIIYSVNPGFGGLDSFTYSVNDSRGTPSNEATVKVTVTRVNEQPKNGGSGGGAAGTLFILFLTFFCGNRLRISVLATRC